MLETLFYVFLGITGLMVACRMLLEYWLRTQDHLSKEEISSLHISEKLAFAFERFCGNIDHAGELRKTMLEERFRKQKLL